MTLYDAHNHLQDTRYGDRTASIIRAARAAGVTQMVVNGTCEADWDAVTALRNAHPDMVIPSYGLHPWRVPDRSPAWLDRLKALLEREPGAVGETGLDRWRKDLPWEGQARVLRAHLELAARLERPVSIHCLRAWGALHDVLRDGPRPACGILLHSYGGSIEMAERFAALGAYFSFCGAFAQSRKARQQDVFRALPLDRLLVETDAPDQLPPEACRPHRLCDADGTPLNHPANLVAIYGFAARLRGMAPASFADTVAANMRRLFGAVMPPAAPSGPDGG